MRAWPWATAVAVAAAGLLALGFVTLRGTGVPTGSGPIPGVTAPPFGPGPSSRGPGRRPGLPPPGRTAVPVPSPPWHGRPPNRDRRGTFTFLLLGVDNRPNQMRILQRTDTLVVVHLDAPGDRVVLLSVPRDTEVWLPGYGIQKINAAAEFAGSYLGAVAAVNRLLGTGIRNYLVVNFQGFAQVVNTLGGVTLDVPRRMVHHGEDATINLYPGVQHLNGNEALQFVRFRDFALGDIGRTEDQQLFLRALARQLVSGGTLWRLPQLVPELARATTTNLSLGQMLQLALALRRLAHARTVAETLPGDFLTYRGLSYWYVVPQDAVRDYGQLLQGHRQPLFDPAAVAAVRAGHTPPAP